MNRSVPHHPELQGPPLTEPFQVRAGTVVFFRLGPGTLVIPTGGAWPGLDNLPEPLIEHLQLYYSVRTPDALITPGLSAADLPAAKALVTAQALTSIGSALARLHLAEQLGIPMRDMNRTTAGGVIRTVREHLCLLLKESK